MLCTVRLKVSDHLSVFCNWIFYWVSHRCSQTNIKEQMTTTDSSTLTTWVSTCRQDILDFRSLAHPEGHLGDSRRGHDALFVWCLRYWVGSSQDRVATAYQRNFRCRSIGITLKISPCHWFAVGGLNLIHWNKMHLLAKSRSLTKVFPASMT